MDLNELTASLAFTLLGLLVFLTMDVIHSPIRLELVGLTFLAFFFSLPYVIIGFLIHVGVLYFIDGSYLVNSWGYLIYVLVLYLSRRQGEQGASVLRGIAILVLPLVYFVDYSILFFYPFVPHLSQYINPLNLFSEKLLDSIISISLISILVDRGIRIDFRKEISGIKLAPILFILLLIPTPLLVNVDRSSDYALDGRIPVPEGWTYVITRMDMVWAPSGAKGVNYYLYPPGRFNSSDIGYQVWFGVYWIQGKYGLGEGDSYDENAIYAFSIIDQDVWLGLHGYKHPVTRVHAVHKIYWGTLDGYKALYMFGSYESQSDVPPYEDVILEGFLIVLYIPSYDRTAIVYACATDYNWPKMNDTLWSLAMQIDFP